MVSSHIFAINLVHGVFYHSNKNVGCSIRVDITAYWNTIFSIPYRTYPIASFPKWLLRLVTMKLLRRILRSPGPLIFQPKQELERPICVSWSTDVEDGRWMTSGCEILEASETHTVCSCHRMANLAIIMASGELTVSTDDLFSGSPSIRSKIQWENID
jgi:hypothetical protein